MAKLVGVLNTAHSPFCYMEAEDWERVQANRPPFRPDVPVDDLPMKKAKAARVQEGFGALRHVLADLRPDVLVVFGDDQNELFDFNNHPAVALFVGDRFAGRVPSNMAAVFTRSGPPPLRPHQEVPGHPGLATHLLVGLLSHGFDPAFMIELPKPDRGMSHAVMNPLYSLTDFSIPTVPVLLNAYYAPQLTGQRCYEVGRAVRQLIDSYPEHLRVAVIGSGGLWHTPGREGSYVDEAFDQAGLDCLASGDIKGWAAHFDAYQAAPDDPSQASSGRGATGLPTPGGPQGGTRETCNWIGAAATVEGRPSVVVDYIPIYASPIGVSFAYCAEP
jgi:3-O-methylgallate 3,4-dioxygenase